MIIIIMISNTIRKQWFKIMDIKKCKNNCICENRIKNTLQKIPVNIIDETFIKFQIKEKWYEYKKCYINKIDL